MRFWLKLSAIGLATLIAQVAIDAGGLLFAIPQMAIDFRAGDEVAVGEFEQRLATCNAATRWVVESYLGFDVRRRGVDRVSPHL